MNLPTELLWTLLRGLTVAAAALAIGGPIARALAGLRGTWRTAAWTLLLAPALTPSIVMSYALTGSGRVAWNEALYAAVLLLKLAPVVAVVLSLLPAPVTAEARHCFRLLPPRSFWRRWQFRWHAAGRGPAIALTLVWLLAFAEFEMAALCSVRSWTVALFDAHAGGLPLAESLRLAALPAAVEGLVLVTLWRCIRGAAPALARRPDDAAKPLPPAVAAYLGVAALLGTVVPLLHIAAQAAPGFPAFAETFALGSDLAASVVFSLGASVAAWFAARPFGPARDAAFMLPGLLGALVVSLLVLALFQLPGFRLAYDTMLPLLLALTLLLLPLAVLLRWILAATRPDSALFIATQLHHRALLWSLEGRRRFAAWALLVCWAFFEFTAASILAPVGFTPVFVRLHNLMHYGQTAVLSAMVCAAFVTPVAVLLLTAVAARFYARHHAC